MIMHDWREGAVGALRMGLHYGFFCLGCCWALMLLLFVTGVMNLLWVAILSIFVLIEKIAPPRLKTRPAIRCISSTRPRVKKSCCLSRW